MKKFILIAVVLLCAFNTFSQQKVVKDTITTYYLIRHAEKDRTNPKNKNPKLNEKGLERAEKWARVFKNIDFDAVYSTNYYRTLKTAKPSADKDNLEIEIYNPKKMYTSKFKKETKGQTVLIVGHSNTTPFFANKILGEYIYEQIADDNNGNLYIITVTKERKIPVLLKID